MVHPHDLPMIVFKINCNLSHIKIVFMIFFGSKSGMSLKKRGIVGVPLCTGGFEGLTPRQISTITSHFLKYEAFSNHFHDTS